MSNVSGVQSHVNLMQALQLASARTRPAATPTDVDRPRATGGTAAATNAAPDHDGDADDVGAHVNVRA